MNATTPEPEVAVPVKTPSRPGSQWATGKRRVAKRKPEKSGFSRGARVK